MPMRWFRVYAGLLNNPKFQRLSDALKVLLLNLWCVAAERDGIIPPSPADLAFLVRSDRAAVERGLDDLRTAGFLDDTDGGLQPHDWNEHQFVSDTSTGRVKEHRKRKRDAAVKGNEGETFHETEVERTGAEVKRSRADTDTDTDTEKKYCSTDDAVEQDDDVQVALSTVIEMPMQRKADPILEWFNSEFWPAYPRHQGKLEALKAARAQLKTTRLRDIAMAALQRQLPELRARDQRMVPLPGTWIRGRRWEDEDVPAVDRTSGKKTTADQAVDEYYAENGLEDAC